MARNSPEPHRPARRRCAVYTRKSSEEGLEQDFNSLDAQREACEAYIRSQAGEGWTCLPRLYDDGGLSGGTMDRPALQRLLADVRDGRIDVVVVYKVDRLTRSLSDFARIVDIFDARGVSFVSITQQFNTTTSMGRLTLNVLLSFAQFEREVTGERIRDKIAASKRKGMWMGGNPPLGYDVRDRRLVVNEEEAETVRHIFRRYLALGTVRDLTADLDAAGIVSKRRVTATGRCWGGKSFTRGALYQMLRNRHYRGEIPHRGHHFPGQHEAIVDADLWEAVQVRLQDNAVERERGTNARSPSLLTGLLFDDAGRRMTPSHAVKRGRRYRYYVSQTLTTDRREASPGGWRVPAAGLERLVVNRLRAFLADAGAVSDSLAPVTAEAGDLQHLIRRSGELARTWPELTPARARFLLHELIARIDVHAGRIDVHVRPARLPHIRQHEGSEALQSIEPPSEENPVTLSIPARLRRAGKEMRMVIDGVDPYAAKATPDPTLVGLLARAHAYHAKLLAGSHTSTSTLAAEENLHRSYFTRVLRLAYLAPDITRAILEGRQPPELTAARLLRTAELPVGWAEQRIALGFD